MSNLTSQPPLCFLYPKGALFVDQEAPTLTNYRWLRAVLHTVAINNIYLALLRGGASLLSDLLGATCPMKIKKVANAYSTFLSSFAITHDHFERFLLIFVDR